LTEDPTPLPKPLSLHDAHMRPVVYEKEDVSPKAIVQWALGLVAFTVFTAGSMLIFLPVSMRYHAKQDPAVAAMTVQERDLVELDGPVRPDGGVALQRTPLLELESHQAAESRAMHRYAVDPATGVVQIPVERAMRLYVERGGNGGPLGAVVPMPPPPLPAAAHAQEPVPAPAPETHR
jgi:hypothetical protein